MLNPDGALNKFVILNDNDPEVTVAPPQVADDCEYTILNVWLPLLK